MLQRRTSSPVSLSELGRRGLTTLALIGLLVACGGGDSEDGSSGAAAESESSSSESSSESDAESSGSGSDAAPEPSSGGGDAIAIVEVNGITYTSTGGSCSAFDDSLRYEGPGESSQGVGAFVSVVYEKVFRADSEGIVDEATLDFMFPDGAESITASSVHVIEGGSSSIDYQTGQPSWVADSALNAEVAFTYENGVVTGQGEALDYSNAVLAVGESTPIVVQQATCG